jgi:hypothetical protein
MLKEYALFIGLILSVVISFYAGHWLTNNHWQAKYSALEADYAKAQVEANNTVRAQERLWQDKLARVTNDAKIKQESLQRDSERLTATVDSLHHTVKVSTSKLQSAGATITELRRTNATSELVRRELLGYCLGRVESLATAFDRSRAAGLTCQSAYEAVMRSDDEAR